MLSTVHQDQFIADSIKYTAPQTCDIQEVCIKCYNPQILYWNFNCLVLNQGVWDFISIQYRFSKKILLKKDLCPALSVLHNKSLKNPHVFISLKPSAANWLTFTLQVIQL